LSRISCPGWLLGWSSLFTDAATEMIYPVLPSSLSPHFSPCSSSSASWPISF
jgi:hypothetical protein